MGFPLLAFSELRPGDSSDRVRPATEVTGRTCQTAEHFFVSEGEPATTTTVSDVVTPVPTLVASVSDGIAWAQDMLTLVFGTVVSLTQLQSDLYSFLMGIAGAAPVMEVGGFVGAGLPPAGDASVVSHGPLIRPLAAIQGVPVVGNAIRVAPLGGMARSTFGAIQIGRQSSLPGMALLVPNDAIPMGEQSFFGYACSELLLPAPPAAGALSGAAGLAILSAAGVLPVSLAALALSALPGAGGLLTLTAAGVRITTTLKGDGKDTIAELYEVLPVFLREAGLQPRATPTTSKRRRMASVSSRT